MEQPQTSLALTDALALNIPSLLQRWEPVLRIESALFQLATLVRLLQTVLCWTHAALTWQKHDHAIALAIVWVALCLLPWQLYLYVPAVLLVMAALLTLIGWSVFFGPLELSSNQPPITATTTTSTDESSSTQYKIHLGVMLEDLASIKSLLADMASRASALQIASTHLVSAAQSITASRTPQRSIYDTSVSTKLEYVHATSSASGPLVVETMVDPFSNPYNQALGTSVPTTPAQDLLTASVLLIAAAGWVLAHKYGFLCPAYIMLVVGLLAIVALSDATLFAIKLATSHIVSSSLKWRLSALNILTDIHNLHSRLLSLTHPFRKSTSSTTIKSTPVHSSPTLFTRLSTSLKLRLQPFYHRVTSLPAYATARLRTLYHQLLFTSTTKILCFFAMLDYTIKQQSLILKNWEKKVELEHRSWAGVEIESEGIIFVRTTNKDSTIISDDTTPPIVSPSRYTTFNNQSSISAPPPETGKGSIADTVDTLQHYQMMKDNDKSIIAKSI